MDSFHVICIGELMREVYLPFRGFPEPNSTLVWDSYSDQFGGPAVNVAWYTTRLGLRALPVCSCGEADSHKLKASFEEMHLPWEGVSAAQSETDLLIAFLVGLEHRSIYLKGRFLREFGPGLPSPFGTAEYLVICGGRHADFRRLFLNVCREPSHGTLVFNPSYATYEYERAELQQIIECVQIVFLNRDEACHACRIIGVRSMEELAARSVGTTFVTTMGDKGVEVIRDGEIMHFPSCASKIINPNGGGDAMLSGFLSRIIRGDSIADAARYGSALAAMVVEDDAIRVPVTHEAVEQRKRVCFDN